MHLVHIKEIDAKKYNRFVIMDSQPSHNSAFERFSYDVIIDHHPDTHAKARYTDIRPNYGATATMMTEYLRAAKIKPSIKLATGLFYATKTDTSNFERQTQIEDVRAFQFLFRHANMHLARRIEQADLSLGFLRYFKLALDTRQIRKGRVFVHLGSVPNPDICVLIADFFLRINTINWSIVSGRVDHTLIVIIRNDGMHKNAGLTAKKSFGHVGSAGGHKSMARAEVPLTKLKNEIQSDDDPAILHWIIRQMEKNVKNR